LYEGKHDQITKFFQITKFTTFFMKKQAMELRGQYRRPKDRFQTPEEGSKFGNEGKEKGKGTEVLSHLCSGDPIRSLNLFLLTFNFSLLFYVSKNSNSARG
jgi:hypothetical protein